MCIYGRVKPVKVRYIFIFWGANVIWLSKLYPSVGVENN